MAKEKDDALWRIARKRADFKKNFFAYIIVNAFLWAIWWFTNGKNGFSGTPWPVWVMLGWGIGLAFQYFNAYNGSRADIANEEYEKLKKEKGM